MSKSNLRWLGAALLTLSLLVSAVAEHDRNLQTVESAAASLPSFIEPLATSLIFPNGGSAIGLAKGDFNRDGRLDLAATQITNVSGVGGRGFVSVMLGMGDATFQTPIDLPIAYDPNLGGFARGILAKDFDRDGVLDLVVDVGEQRKVLFFKGRGDGTFDAPVSFGTIDRCLAVQAADLDGDGNLDIVTLNSLSGDHSVSVLPGNGDGTFKPASAYSTNMQANSLALVDVNAQNRVDIVIGCFGDGNNLPSVDVLLNNGSGAFPPVATTFTQQFQVTGLNAADFDGDSKVDVVATGFGGPTSRSVVFIKGSGDGTFISPPDQNFQAVEDIPAGSTRFAENVVLDLDGDGHLDVIIIHGGVLNIVTVGLGRGDGSFRIQELVSSNGPGFTHDNQGNPVTADGNSTNSAISGDFNGDGKQDLVVAAESGNGGRPGGVSIILGAGQGNFLTPRSAPALLNGSCFCYAGGRDRSTALGDFNGDGKLDLIALDSGSDGPFAHIAEVQFGNGDGTFEGPIVALGGTSGLGTGASTLKVADMNRDGKLDVIVTSGPAGVQGNGGTTATRVAYGVGNGTFAYAAELPPGDGNWSIPNVLVGDFNNDLVPDLAVLTGHGFNGGTQKRTQHIEVFIQSPNQIGTFTRTGGFPQTDLGENNGDGIATADVDRDGKLDLIAGGGGGSNASDQVMLLKGNGDGTFQPAAPVGAILLAGGTLFGVQAIDLNNDNKLDLLATGFGGISVYLGNGNGNFQPSVFYASGGGNTPSTDIADLDGDGRVDVAFANGQGGFTALRGRGDGTFAAPIFFAIGYLAGQNVQTGDLNGDGKLDLVIGHGIDSRENLFATILINNTPTVQFASATFGVNEGAGIATITVNRVGNTSDNATVDYSTIGTTYLPCDAVGGVASQNCDFAMSTGTLAFAAGEVSKTFTVIIVDDVYVEGVESLNLSLSSPTGAVLGIASTATLTITDNDTVVPSMNPLDDQQSFVQQHYYDFLSRLPDAGGLAYWTSQITGCGLNEACIHNRRIDVSNAFFYELEFQQTGSYVFRLYRIAFGNNQPFPNPDNSNPAEAAKLPSYAEFVRDRARVVAGRSLAQAQFDLASKIVQRPEFLSRYPSNLNSQPFVDALLLTINDASAVNLNSQRAALINLFNQGGPATVLYRLADDNLQSNPIDNRALLDAEYNRAFVYTQYAGYLRRDADIGGFLFWLAQVNAAPVRDASKQHSMVCAFITSREYQQRFSSVVTRFNSDCGRF